MHIGILTFHNAINYGAVFQALALRTFLVRMGHEVSIIDYRRGPQPRLPWFLRLLWRTVRCDSASLRKEIPFRLFRMRYLNETKHGVSVADCTRNGFDAVIVGSDQVWNPIYFIDNNGRIDDNYFLSGIPDGCRRIAYAASMGEARLGDYAKAVKAMLQRFTSISVRERFAQSALTSLGLPNVQVVPDPTLLLSRSDYATLCKRCDNIDARRRVFMYALGEVNRCTEALFDEIEADVGCVGRAVILRKYRMKAHRRICRFYPTPSRWLYEIRSADLIITDSYHCMVMAIIHHKPFRMIYKTLEPMTNDRMKTLLDILGIVDTEHPDWEAVDRHLSDWRQVGERFLLCALA